MWWGYSRLMGADEEGTHERFKAHLVELIDPKTREHHGRIVKTTSAVLMVRIRFPPADSPSLSVFRLRS
jgi:hypothetical protein